MMHAVGEVNVHMPGAFKHGVVAFSATTERMTSFVRLVVGLCLDDTHPHFLSVNLTYQFTAEQPSGRRLGRYVEPCEVVSSHGGLSLPQNFIPRLAFGQFVDQLVEVADFLHSRSFYLFHQRTAEPTTELP